MAVIQQMVRDSRNNVMRPEPHMPVGGMQTYQVLLPLKTHWRAATCAEVNCPHYLNGWRTRVVADSPDERAVRASGRKWVSRTTDGGFVVYDFAAGTRCFKADIHRVQLDRPALFVRRMGDWRWSGQPQVFDRPDQWVDHFATHQDRLSRKVNGG